MSEVTTQDMFNTMVRHLIKQRVRSTQADGYSCAYRGVDGTMCAVGVLIADEHYHADLETNIASSSCVLAAVEASIKRGLTVGEVQLLCKMQSIHDYSWHDLKDKIRRMRNTARNFRLEMPDYSDIYQEQAQWLK